MTLLINKYMLLASLLNFSASIILVDKISTNITIGYGYKTVECVSTTPITMYVNNICVGKTHNNSISWVLYIEHNKRYNVVCKSKKTEGAVIMGTTTSYNETIYNDVNMDNTIKQNLIKSKFYNYIDIEYYTYIFIQNKRGIKRITTDDTIKGRNMIVIIDLTNYFIYLNETYVTHCWIPWIIEHIHTYNTHYCKALYDGMNLVYRTDDSIIWYNQGSYGDIYKEIKEYNDERILITNHTLIQYNVYIDYYDPTKIVKSIIKTDTTHNITISTNNTNTYVVWYLDAKVQQHTVDIVCHSKIRYMQQSVVVYLTDNYSIKYKLYTPDNRLIAMYAFKFYKPFINHTPSYYLSDNTLYIVIILCLSIVLVIVLIFLMCVLF